MVKTVLINYIQHKILKSRAKYKTWIGGRGSGKTTFMALLIGLLYQVFPRGTWVVAGKTYAAIDSTVMTAISELPELMNITEYSEHNPDGDYVIGKEPPPHFKKPYKYPAAKIRPNCVFFKNGFCLRIVSQTLKDTHRGLSIDGILVEEAAIVEYENFIGTVLLPARRSNQKAEYIDHPWRGGVVVISSSPWTPQGNWVYDIEEKYKKEQIERKEAVKNLSLHEKKKWITDNPPKYLFVESTSEANLPFLGDDYIDKQKASMEPWKFDVEVMNKRVAVLPNAYYHQFSDFNKYKAGIVNTEHGLLSNDYGAAHPIYLSLDFNADITWTLIIQRIANEDRLIDTIFKKPIVSQTQEQSLIVSMAVEFCERYKDHPTKTAYLYGDPNGNSRNADTNKNNLPFFDKYVEVLKANGWKVIRCELVSYPPTKLRYELVNLFCGGMDPRMNVFRVNEKNVDFLIALRATQTKIDKSFRKDKSSEKLARYREHATDPTDALDYFIWGVYSNLVLRRKSVDSGVSVR